MVKKIRLFTTSFMIYEQFCLQPKDSAQPKNGEKIGSMKKINA
jgi:hypothetical protein